jgi:hypothetical protein
MQKKGTRFISPTSAGRGKRGKVFRDSNSCLDTSCRVYIFRTRLFVHVFQMCACILKQMLTQLCAVWTAFRSFFLNIQPCHVGNARTWSLEENNKYTSEYLQYPSVVSALNHTCLGIELWFFCRRIIHKVRDTDEKGE